MNEKRKPISKAERRIERSRAAFALAVFALDVNLYISGSAHPDLRTDAEDTSAIEYYGPFSVVEYDSPHALPPIYTDWPDSGSWQDPDSAPDVRAYGVASTDVPAGLKITYDNLPRPYSDAVRKSVDNPIVQLALTNGDIKEVQIQATGSDNGSMDSDTGTLGIQLSDGTASLESRLYYDDRMVEYTFIHEALHALNSEWYRYLVDGEQPDDPVLATKLDTVFNACSSLRDRNFHNFVNRSEDRGELIQALEDESSDYRSNVTATSDPSIASYAASLEAAASAVKNDDPKVYDALMANGSRACEPYQIAQIPKEMSDIDNLDSLPGNSNDHLGAIQQKLDATVRQSFVCSRDGETSKDFLEVDVDSVNAGHGQDNITEAASALQTSLAIEPKFIVSCLQSVVDMDDKEIIYKYLAAILDVSFYTNPELEAEYRRDPDTNKVIDFILTYSQ